MKLVTITLVGLLNGASAQLFPPQNDAVYRISEAIGNINGARINTSMTATDRNVLVRQTANSGEGIASQRWKIVGFDPDDNTTALWSEQKNRYAGYTGDPGIDTPIVLTDVPTRFRLVERRKAFLIAIPSASGDTGDPKFVAVRTGKPPYQQASIPPIEAHFANNQ
ncbi:hypothetical protein FRC08_018909 [Ceratobasidium sp. 394]|nr:hypothetical protein FRC08_018909 [Ceratobasidium sp. 394]KAG9096925.1 hypothetical protein FS749_007450 [Ceratobasidium sp. UAMH 11750]